MSIVKMMILAAISFCLSFVITPFTVPLCRTVGALDFPDGFRKIHKEPTPRLGGLGFFSACFLVLSPLVAANKTIAALLAGGAIITASGIADDVFNISPKIKLVLQSFAALTAITIIGLPDSFSFFGLFYLPISGLVGFIFVLVRILFTMNAVNFSDGLDGLASGVSAVAFLSLFVYGLSNFNTLPALASLVLFSAVLGFLPYNKYHARIYMGDSGSQFLGLAISLLSLGCSPDGNFNLESSLFLAIPALDTTLSVARRLAKGKSPFVADKGHLHHLLLSLGLSHPFAVKLLVSLSATIASTILRPMPLIAVSA